MFRSRPFTRSLLLVLAAFGLVAQAPRAFAVREAKPGAAAGEADLEASRLFETAQDLLKTGESERGVKMLETIAEQYPASRIRFPVYLALGKYCLNAHEELKAISYLANLKSLEKPDGEVEPADRELYLEGMYSMGLAHFQMRNYEAAFPILRKITTRYPNSVWANQAFYYIGMCHFVQQNWAKAIEALSLVGTFVDPSSPGAEFLEAGRRAYIKVTDKDLPVLVGLGKTVSVEVQTARGDRETVACAPIGGEGDVQIASVATEIGPVKAGDGVLQLAGGDRVTLRYVDANAESGAANTNRDLTVQVVSTAAATFTLGDYETAAPAAFLDQPLCLLLQDADLDTTDAADSVTVKVVARYLEAPEAEEEKSVDLRNILDGKAERKYATRDELSLRLTERGEPPVHSARFTGSIPVQTARPDAPATPTDETLSCAVGDEIIVTYIDEKHIGGVSPRLLQATIQVSGEIDNRPRATQDVVPDAVLRARKNLVEAAAYLELARIFKSMGLMKGAKTKSAEGIERVESVILTTSPIPSELKEQAFKAKWELHLAADDFSGAMAACTLFNKLFPDSPLVDEALMSITAIHMDNKDYDQAMAVLRQVLALPKSQAKAAAQFRIAEATEAIPALGPERAIQEYKLCAERYPDSEFAGPSLAKLIDYHIQHRDFDQAGELLSQIFQDHPDASFLDTMLLKWVLVAYQSGDYAKARDKCAQLLSEYPTSAYVSKAKDILPKIEAKLKDAQMPANGGSGQ